VIKNIVNIITVCVLEFVNIITVCLLHTHYTYVTV